MAYQSGSVDKNSPPAAKALWKSRIALGCLLGMIGGLLCSRAIASIAMILFGINALWDVDPRRWAAQRWWLLGLGWIALYALSYFWSDDKGVWSEHLQVKLPFLLLPLSFAFLPAFSPQMLRLFTWCNTAMMCAGALFSLYFLWHSPGDIIEQYQYAHLLRTPVYNDHIAFSTLVAMSIAWLAFYMPQMPRGRQRWLFTGAGIFLAVYLHVLAAKTGLAALYILAAGLAARQLRANLRRGLLCVVLLVAAAVFAFTFLPTLRARAGYSFVTWRSYIMGERHGIYSDAGRIFSYDIALRAIAAHPAAGVGAGDVLLVMAEGYAKWYPQVPRAQQLWPHNQWLTCAMAAGIPAAILFTLWIAAPLRRVRRTRGGFFFTLTWGMLLVPLLVDPFLEVQFGVAVYLIFLLWQRKTMLGSDAQANDSGLAPRAA